MRLLILGLAAAPLLAQSTTHTPRGPAARPEALAWQRYVTQSQTALGELKASAATSLPPLPAGVSHLDFSEFFGPIGDRGLEYSPKLRSLDGQRVRLVGYMVREPERSAGVYRLTAWPVKVETDGFCVADDTPPATVHIVAVSPTQKIPWQPGQLILTGTLELGARVESDGRNSIFRLVLDPTSEPANASASPLP